MDTGEPEPPQRPGPTISVDMGLQTLATLWDGDEQTEIENPRPLQEALAELRHIDQAIAHSRKVHGTHRTSHRREALYARVSPLRNDHHRTTTASAKRGGTVQVEILHLAGMQRNRRLGRALGDADLAEFVRQLEYQCAWYGTAFGKVDRRYLSAKTCSACGAVKQSLLLSERTYRCVACGFACDRDANAARNLQAFDPAARSVVADAETRRSGRPTGLPGPRSVHRTGSPFPMYAGKLRLPSVLETGTRTMTHIRVLALGLVALIALVGCSGIRAPVVQEDAPAAVSADDPTSVNVIHIGAAVSETGKYSREGRDTRQGYGTWLEWVNNEYGGIDVADKRYRVELVMYDDEGDPDTVARLVEQLIREDRVDFLLGPKKVMIDEPSAGLAPGISRHIPHHL